MYNPLKIPIEQIDEKKGTIAFTVKESNLFNKEIKRLRMLEIYKKQTVFVLERDEKFNLKFIQSNPNYNTKIAKVNIKGLSGSSKLYISFTWSEKSKNMIYVGDYKSNY